MHLQEIIRLIRKLTKKNAGNQIKNNEFGKSTQLVDFHETLEYMVYFKKNQS